MENRGTLYERLARVLRACLSSQARMVDLTRCEEWVRWDVDEILPHFNGGWLAVAIYKEDRPSAVKLGPRYEQDNAIPPDVISPTRLIATDIRTMLVNSINSGERSISADGLPRSLMRDPSSGAVVTRILSALAATHPSVRLEGKGEAGFSWKTCSFDDVVLTLSPMDLENMSKQPLPATRPSDQLAPQHDAVTAQRVTEHLQPDKDIRNYVIFMDVANYSKETTDRQVAIIKSLTQIVQGILNQAGLELDRHCIALPTGDGFALCLLDSTPAALADLGWAIYGKVNTATPRFGLKIGMDYAHDRTYRDINGRINVAGLGINYAQRVMAAAQRGQIVVSDRLFRELNALDRFRPRLVALEPAKTKHGEEIRVYALKGESTPK